MSSTAIKNRQEQKYQAIMLDSIRVDSVLDFDLYLQIGGQLILYRSANLSFNDRSRQKLMDNRVDKLYISISNRQNYQKYIEKNLPIILEDPNVEESNVPSRIRVDIRHRSVARVGRKRKRHLRGYLYGHPTERPNRYHVEI